MPTAPVPRRPPADAEAVPPVPDSPGHDGAPLHPLYYRDNFDRLCHTVLRQYGDLLEQPEQGFFTAFAGLSGAAQCLYVRLVSRVGPWFRSDRLDYPEIGPARPPLAELERAGLLLRAVEPGLEELARLYTAAEFRAAFPEAGAGLRGKAALLQAVAELGRSGADLLARLAPDHEVVAPARSETVALLQLLFFGNRRQDLTEFVLSDLGLARYYPYRLDRSRRLFRDRQALDEYLAWSALWDLYLELREAADGPALIGLAQELQVPDAGQPPGRERQLRLYNALARDLERLGEPDLAETLYRRSDAHPARERRARIREGRGDWRGALALCREIERDPWCEAELDAARRIGSRARRKLEGVAPPRPRDDFAGSEWVIPRGELGVERAAAAALASRWQAVHYVENTLMNCLFGLAFWEQIFAPVPGVFHNPFQSVPADMYRPGFRRARAGPLRARLAELRRAPLAPELLAAWDRYGEYQCRWINRRAVDRGLLRQSLAVLPEEHLLSIWERMLFDPGENRRGFPDLLALGAAPGEYRLIEVKGPGDTLRDCQKRWLRFFAASGIPAEVMRVRWADD